MYRITNCMNDRSKEELRRTVPGLVPEPSLGGTRIRIGESIDIDDAHFEEQRKLLEGWRDKGVIVFEKIGGEAPAPEAAPPAPPPSITADPGAGAAITEETVDEAVTDDAPVETTSKKSSGKKKLF